MYEKDTRKIRIPIDFSCKLFTVPRKGRVLLREQGSNLKINGGRSIEGRPSMISAFQEAARLLPITNRSRDRRRYLNSLSVTLDTCFIHYSARPRGPRRTYATVFLERRERQGNVKMSAHLFSERRIVSPAADVQRSRRWSW